MYRKALLFISVVVGLAVGASTALADTQPPAPQPPASTTPVPASSAPAGFLAKNWRLNVNLEDVQGLVFQGRLTDTPQSTPAPIAQYIKSTLYGVNFSLDASSAKCYVIQGSSSSLEACAKIADMVGYAADGGVDAAVLARPTTDSNGDLAFVVKRLTVWIDSGGTDAAPPADTTPAYSGSDNPAPPTRFFNKNLRLHVNLQDHEDLVFDATLNEILSSVSQKAKDYLSSQLDGSSFEIDASKATCFIVKAGTTKPDNCNAVLALLDASPDGGVDAVALLKPVNGPDGLSFVAKKITISV